MRLRSGQRVNQVSVELKTMRLPSRKRVNQASGFSLPDELVTSILVRLPAEDILRCRRVCRRWRALTSTQYFVNTHARNREPVILLAKSFNNSTYRSDQVLFRRWWEPEIYTSYQSDQVLFRKWRERGTSRPIMRRLYPTRFKGYARNCSGHGLLVLKPEHNSRRFIVFNPVRGKEVTILFPQLLHSRTQAFAIYFHPTLQQYCILWAVYDDFYYPRSEKGVQYMILTLGSSPCWRKIRNPWINKIKNPFKSALLLGRYIYWLVKPIALENEEFSGTFAIMEFDILSEELNLMPSPVYASVKNRGYNRDLLYNENINLLDVHGRLSLFIITPFPEGTVCQWTLVSREEKLWTSSIIDVKKGTPISFLKSPLRAVALADESLLVNSSRLLVINLKLGEVREVVWEDCCFSNFLPHVITLASLRNCNSRIVIEEKDEEIRVKKKVEPRKRLGFDRACKKY